MSVVVLVSLTLILLVIQFMYTIILHLCSFRTTQYDHKLSIRETVVDLVFSNIHLLMMDTNVTMEWDR